jgi:hypothetical protein
MRGTILTRGKEVAKRPPQHGVIRTVTWKKAHAKAHLVALSASAAEVRDYGGHEATGFSCQRSFSSGGAAGVDYTTTNVGSDVADADSGNPSGY